MADDIKSLEGTTTVDAQVVFEAQRLSYDAAIVIAAKIARRISERTKGREVVVAGTQLLADLGNLVAMKTVLRELARDYDAVTGLAHPSPLGIPIHKYLGDLQTAFSAIVAPTIGAVTAGVQGVLSLVSLFRQDVDYKGVPIAIDSRAFEIELAARIRMHKSKEVIVPDFSVLDAPATDAESLLFLIEEVKTARAAAMHAVAPAKTHTTKSVDIELEPVHEAGEIKVHHRVALPRETPSKPDALTDAIAEIDKRFNDLQSQLGKADTDGSGLTMLARLLRAETIMSRSPMFVHARVVLAGGSNRVQRSLMRTIFTGDGLSSTGGAVVSWAILNANGAVEDGGILSESRSAKSPKPPEDSLSIA
jgi:hypothetical protein